MKVSQSFRSSLAIAAFAFVLPLGIAQSTDHDAKQDMKDAGSDTKHAAVSAGHGISHGTKTVVHKTVHGTKKGYHKTAHATKTGVHKIEGKPNTPANNPPQ